MEFIQLKKFDLTYFLDGFNPLDVCLIDNINKKIYVINNYSIMCDLKKVLNCEIDKKDYQFNFLRDILYNKSSMGIDDYYITRGI